MSLIELKPYGRCTANMATNRTAAIGKLASATKAPTRHCQAAKYFNQYRGPRHEVWCRHADRMQDGAEGFRTPAQLGKTMRHETISNDQAQRDGSPARERTST